MLNQTHTQTQSNPKIWGSNRPNKVAQSPQPRCLPKTEFEAAEERAAGLMEVEWIHGQLVVDTVQEVAVPVAESIEDFLVFFGLVLTSFGVGFGVRVD